MAEDKTNLDFDEIELKETNVDKNDALTFPKGPSVLQANDSDTELVAIKRTSSIFGRLKSFSLNVMRNVTLEPAIFLIELGTSAGMASYSQMTIDKSCHDHGYNATVCNDLLNPNYSMIHTKVTDNVSNNISINIHDATQILCRTLHILHVILFLLFLGCPIQRLHDGSNIGISNAFVILLWCMG